MSDQTPDPRTDFLPPELPRPRKPRKGAHKKRRITLDIINRYCKALGSLPFEAKAADACGLAWNTLMTWKREGRAYLQECEEKDVQLDVYHPDYICAYLVVKVERVKAAKKAALLGDIAKDTDWRAKRYILSIMDRDFAERRRHDWGLELGDAQEDGDESRAATELRITVVKSRAEPDDVPEEGKNNGPDASGDATALDET